MKWKKGSGGGGGCPYSKPTLPCLPKWCLGLPAGEGRKEGNRSSHYYGQESLSLSLCAWKCYFDMKPNGGYSS